MDERYAEDDLILPLLKLASPCPVRVEVRNEFVNLTVGQRDWSWSRKDGKLVGCGTTLDDSFPDIPDKDKAE